MGGASGGWGTPAGKFNPARAQNVQTPPTFAQELPGPSAPPPPEPQYAPRTMSRGVMGQGQPTAPQTGGILQTLMNIPKSFAVHDDGTVKKPPDPGMVDAAAKGTGATFEQANAMMNAHHYTQDEFVNAIRGMPIALVEKLWNMQHYLNPQQQVEGAYNKQLQAGVDTAAQELQNARQTAGTPEGKLKDFEAALAKQQAEQTRHRQVVTEGQGAYFPQQQYQQ
jgi:hypothetical protein